MSIKAAFIVPHPPLSVKEVGRGKEFQIEKTIESYNSIAKQIAEIKPDTIVISTPHTKVYSDYFSVLSSKTLEGSFKNFLAPQVSFTEENDLELVNEIDKICKDKGFPGGILDEEVELDHGVMVPLYFIRKYYDNFKIVVVGLSGLSYIVHFKMGQIINKAIENTNKNVVYIASGDLSHKLQEDGPYGYIEEGTIYENKIVQISKNAAFEKLLATNPNLCEKAAVCGHKSFIIMSGAINKKKLDTTFYSHEDVTGVGYEILSYYITEDDEKNDYLNIYLNQEKERLERYYNYADDYILLAKKTIDEYIKNNNIIEIRYNINKELLDNKAGVFVSIHKHNRLRGCIGTIISTKDNIAEEIITNAISAATRDFRFDPITVDELDYLEINVDVLTKPIVIQSINELDPKKYGVIVSSGFKRGVLLPDLENVDTVEEQLSIAKSKGNITNNEDVIIEKFEVIRHKSK